MAEAESAHRCSRHGVLISVSTATAALLIHLLIPTIFVGAQSSRPLPAKPLTAQLNQALSLAEDGQDDRALETTNDLLRKNPKFVPALKLQGAILEKAGKNAEAAQSYKEALDESPNDPGLLFKLGTLQMAMGDNGQAVSYLLRYTRISPKDADALFYLAQAHHLTGRNDLAINEIKECLAIEPKNAQFLQVYGELLDLNGDIRQGLEVLLKAQALNPKLDKIDFDIGMANYDNMNFAQAAAYASKALENRSNNVEALRLLGSAQEKLSRWEPSKSTFQRLLQLKKNDLVSLLGLGHCELELKQYPQAIESLQYLLHLDPTQTVAHYYLSRALAGIGNADQSGAEAELYHRMEQMSFIPPALETESGEAAWNRARQLLKDHREDEALKQFQKDSNGADESLGDAYVLVGSLYLSMGNSGDGLRTLRRALEIEPNVRGAHTYIGSIDLEQDRLKDAGEEFSAELKNDPNYLSAIAGLGEVDYRKGDWLESANLLAKSKSKSPRLLYMLCDSYFRIGKIHDAELTARILFAYAQSDSAMMRQLNGLMARNGERFPVQQSLGGAAR